MTKLTTSFLSAGLLLPGLLLASATGCGPTRPASRAAAANAEPKPAVVEPAPAAAVPPAPVPVAAAKVDPPKSDQPRAIGIAARSKDPALASEFNNLFVDGDVYFAGWPTEAGLRAMAARGVKTVIALKTPEQVEQSSGFNPRRLAAQLGIELVIIPVRADTYSRNDVLTFAAAFDKSRGPVLIHCGSASTCGMVWSGYLVEKRGMSAADAVERGHAAGLQEGPMTEAAERVAGELQAKR